MEIDKRKIHYAAFYYFMDNSFLFTISLCGCLPFLLSIPTLLQGHDLWTLVFVIFTIYPIYRTVVIIRNKKKILREQYEMISVDHPSASLLIVNGSRSGKIVCGLKISGEVQGKKRTLRMYISGSNQKAISRTMKEINEMTAYPCKVVQGSNLVFNFYGKSPNPSEKIKIEKLKEEIFYFDFLNNKKKKVRFPSVDFNFENVLRFLDESDIIEELFLVNPEKKFVKIAMYPEADGDPRGFFLNEKETTLAEIRAFLEKNNFVYLDQVKIFELFDHNSPALLKKTIQ